LFLGVFVVLLQAGLARLKDDPVATGKLASLKRALSIRRSASV